MTDGEVIAKSERTSARCARYFFQAAERPQNISPAGSPIERRTAEACVVHRGPRRPNQAWRSMCALDDRVTLVGIIVPCRSAGEQTVRPAERRRLLPDAGTVGEEISSCPPSRFTSFDDFVGAREQRRRHCEADRLGSLRLMASSYLVGACTGRSAGFSPLRMRSTYWRPSETGRKIRTIRDQTPRVY